MSTIEDDINTMIHGNILGDMQLRLVLSDALMDVGREYEADLLRKSRCTTPLIAYNEHIIDARYELHAEVGNSLGISIRLAYADALEKSELSRQMTSIQRYLATVGCYRNLSRNDIDGIIQQNRQLYSTPDQVFITTEWDPTLMIYVVSSSIEGDLESDRFVICRKDNPLHRSSLAYHSEDREGTKLIVERRYYRKEIN